MAEKKVNVPQEINDYESLLRAVSTPSCLDNESKATPLAFRLKPNETELSLSRLLFEDLYSFLKRSLHFTFRFLSFKDVPAGAVELKAGEVNALDEHIILKASPSSRVPSHASICFKNIDGSDYIVNRNTTEPVDPSILGYEMALASIVRNVYDDKGKIIWSSVPKSE